MIWCRSLDRRHRTKRRTDRLRHHRRRGYLDQLVSIRILGSDCQRGCWWRRPAPVTHSVTLPSTKDNSRAIRFYERNGLAHAATILNRPRAGRWLKMIWLGVTLVTPGACDVCYS